MSKMVNVHSCNITNLNGFTRPSCAHETTKQMARVHYKVRKMTTCHSPAHTKRIPLVFFSAAKIHKEKFNVYIVLNYNYKVLLFNTEAKRHSAQFHRIHAVYQTVN